MTKFIKLMAMVMAVAMVMACAMVPAMADEQVTYFVNETFDGFTNEGNKAVNADLGDKFGYISTLEAGADTWTTSVADGKITAQSVSAANEAPNFFYRKLDTVMTATNAENTVITFDELGTSRAQYGFQLVNSKGEVLAAISILNDSTGAYVYEANAGVGGTARKTGSSNIKPNRKVSSDASRFEPFPRDKNVRVHIFPDLAGRGFGLALENLYNGTYWVIKPFFRMSSATADYDIAEIRITSGMNGAGLFTAGNDQKAAVVFDNIVAKTATAAEIAKYSEAIERDMTKTTYTDDFEWAEEEIQVSNGRIYSSNSGRSVTSVVTREDDAANYKIPSDVEFTTSLVEVPGKGKVFDFYTPRMRDTRGVIFDSKNIESKFVEIEFEYNAIKGGGFTNYLYFTNVTADGKDSYNSIIRTNVYPGSVTVRSRTADGATDKNMSVSLANILKDGALAANEWHTIKYLVNCAASTFDLFVDGKLVLSDATRFAKGYVNESSSATIAFDKLLVASINTGEYHIQVNDYKARAVSPAEAASITKAGFDALIGDGVYYGRSKSKVYLPNQGMYGANMLEHGAYKVVDTDGTVIHENKGKPTLSYSFPEGSLTYAADGASASKDIGSGRVIKWYFNPLAVQKMKTAATAEEKAAVKNIGLSNLEYKTIAADTYIEVPWLAGRYADPVVDFSVTFKKDFAEVTGDYSITLKRELLAEYMDGVEVGVMVPSNISGSGTLSGTYAQAVTWVGNNSGEDKTLAMVIGYYDADGNLIGAFREAKAFANGTSAEFKGYHNHKGAANLVANTKMVKVFVWDADSFAPAAAVTTYGSVQ